MAYAWMEPGWDREFCKALLVCNHSRDVPEFQPQSQPLEFIANTLSKWFFFQRFDYIIYQYPLVCSQIFILF